MSADEGVELEVVGGTVARRPAIPVPRPIADGTIAIGVGAAASAGFVPPAATTFVTDMEAGRWQFVAFAIAGLILVALGVWQQRWMRLKSSAGVVVTVDDGAGDPDQLRHDRLSAERQLARECTVAMAVSTTVPGPGSDNVANTVDRTASRVVQALTIAEQIAADPPSLRLAPMMRLHMAFRFGARIGHTFDRTIILMDKSQEEGFFPALRLRADRATGSQLDLTVESVQGVEPGRAALAINLLALGHDFRGPVLAACGEYRYGHLMLLQSRSPRLDTSRRMAYQAVVEEICRTWRDNEQLPAEVRVADRGIFLAGPPSIAVALGARLARPAIGLWTPYYFDPTEGRYRPLVSPGRARP
jgi:hypothetical protein